MPMIPRDTASTAAAQLDDLTATSLPIPSEAVVPYEEALGPQAEAISQRMAELDMGNTQSILSFGAAAQGDLRAISQEMLAGVKAKDLGPAGQSLAEIVATIRGFSGAELDANRRRSWWEKLTGAAAPVAQFIARYEQVQLQIDQITQDLLSHETVLLKDIKALDLLYTKTLAFYDELALYIAAGQAKLQSLDTTDLPALNTALAQAPEAEQIKRAQDLRDLRMARDDLERRVYDLQLTRQVTMQALPSIRLVQENDKSLVSKINATLINTVPLWETQLAQALTIQRSRDAADAVRGANDLTNALLTQNAKTLGEANTAVRTEIERGVFDIEAVKTANDILVATIQDSLAIADAGKAKRAEAAQELGKMETALKEALSAAKASARPAAGQV
ncbi:MAG: toxic anion resistance protein [Pseudomonadota bacterium]